MALLSPMKEEAAVLFLAERFSVVRIYLLMIWKRLLHRVMMLILMEGNAIVINKWRVTIRRLGSRNQRGIFSSDLNNNPLVFKPISVLNYV